MNKGRNILLVLACLLCISVLTFFSTFTQSNNQGVVDNVRYVKNSNDDETITYKFYFEKGEPTNATVTQSDTHWFVLIEDYEYTYSVEKASENQSVGAVKALKDGAELTDDKAFSLYTEDFFKAMFGDKKPLITALQAVIVAVIVFAGGAIILLAEELWHIVFKKGAEEIPAWKDMNGIKYVGGGVIAVGVILLLVFIFV